MNTLVNKFWVRVCMCCTLAGVIQAATVEPAASPTPGPAVPKFTSVTAALMPDPGRLLVSSFSWADTTRTICLVSGTGSSSVKCKVRLPVTADGLHALPASAIVVNSNKDDFSVEPGLPILLPVEFKIGDIPSGEYAGDIILCSTNTASTIQLVVRVKDRPWLPMIVLLCGIGLSVVLSHYRETGRQCDMLVLQASKLEQILATDTELSKVPPFKNAIANALEAARKQLDEERYADATNEVAVIRKVVDNWLTRKAAWVYLYGRLNELKQEAGMNADAGVRSLLQKAEMAANDAPNAAGPDNLEMAIQAVVAALKPRAVAGGGGRSPLERGQKLMFTPGDVEHARRRMNAYLIVSHAMMVAFFFFVGYKELYDAKPVFGSDFLVDYFTLVLWGFGVETTSRTSLAALAKTWGIPGFG